MPVQGCALPFMYSRLPKVNSELQLLIFHTNHPYTLYLHTQESEDPWLPFVAARAREQIRLGNSGLKDFLFGVTEIF